MGIKHISYYRFSPKWAWERLVSVNPLARNNELSGPLPWIFKALLKTYLLQEVHTCPSLLWAATSARSNLFSLKGNFIKQSWGHWVHLWPWVPVFLATFLPCFCSPSPILCFASAWVGGAVLGALVSVWGASSCPPRGGCIKGGSRLVPLEWALRYLSIPCFFFLSFSTHSSHSCYLRTWNYRILNNCPGAGG